MLHLIFIPDAKSHHRTVNPFYLDVKASQWYEMSYSMIYFLNEWTITEKITYLRRLISWLCYERMCFYDVAVVKSSLQVPLLSFLEASFLRHSSVFHSDGSLWNITTVNRRVLSLFSFFILFIACLQSSSTLLASIYFFLSVFAAGDRIMSRISVQHAALFLKSSPSTLNVNQWFAYSNCTVNSTWGISL